MTRWLLLIAMTVVVFLPTDVWSQGCAMCKAVAEEGMESESESRGSGLNQGILYLMFIPYVIFFFLFRKKIFKFFRELRDVYN